MKSSRGITLIELLLVVAIMATIGVMTTGFYSRFLLQSATSDVTSQLLGSFRKAQIYSLMSKQSDGWSVNYGGIESTITLYKGSNFASRDASFDEKFTVNSNVAITGFTNINYSKATGLPTPTSATINITTTSDNIIITLNNQGIVSRN